MLRGTPTVTVYIIFETLTFKKQTRGAFRTQLSI